MNRRHRRLWFELLRLSWRQQSTLAILFLACQVAEIAALAGLGLMIRSAIDHSARGAVGAAVVGAVGAALGYAGTTILRSVALSLRLQLVERTGVTIVDSEIVRSIAEVPGMEHLERPDYLDRVSIMRGAGWGIVDWAWGTVEAALAAIRLAVIVLLLVIVSPWLLGLLPFAALPLWFDRYGRRAVKRAELESAELMRLQRHFFELATSAAAGKELRVANATVPIIQRQRAAWSEAHSRRLRAQWAVAGWKCAGWLLFAVGFGAGLAFVVDRAMSGRSTAGDVVLAVTMATTLHAAVQLTVYRATEVTGYSRLLDPYLWLRDHAARELAHVPGEVPAPTRLRDGVRLDRVTFTYPGGTRPAVENVGVHLAAGSVVAIVGEYGSGKTTLVKLLCRYYRPDSGTIDVEGVDLARIGTASWRAAMSVAFQDFGRYHTTMREAVGLGDLPHLTDSDRIAEAVRLADAEALAERLPQGLDSQLGTRFGGIELSEGQWQKTALARACMRREPVLFILDEPTASLDAPSEQAIFDNYFHQARALSRRTGAITIVISHRFSTVAGADHILVMHNGSIVESGSHESLMSLDGRYAELYGIQTRAYSTVGG